MDYDSTPIATDHDNATDNDHSGSSNSPQQADPLVSESGSDTRHRTTLQRRTSQSNGRKSQGPTSLPGKRKSARNAIRDGISSRQVVIPEIGETREEFEKFATDYFEYLFPLNAPEELAVRDFVESAWVRERVRKAEEQARCERFKTFQLEDELRRDDELKKLTGWFLQSFEEYVSDVPTGLGIVPPELEDIRQKLIWTTEGIDFLLNVVERIATSEVLSSKEAAMLRVIGGAAHPLIVSCQLDQLTEQNDFRECGSEMSEDVPINEAKREQEHSKTEASGNGEYEGGPLGIHLKKELVAALINSVAGYLKDRRKKLKTIEEAKKSEQIRSIVLDPSGSDRFSRAGTRVERCMHKALAAFFVIRANADLTVSALPGSTRYPDIRTY